MSTIYLEIRQALSSHYDEREARAIAFLVLEEAFGVKRLDVYADKVRHFSQEENQRLQIILQRLQGGEPVQHVLGRARFAGMDLRVTPDTLIPRPETEELVEHAVRLSATIPHGGVPLHIVDGGTGSGCIAIALAQRLPEAEVEAWDLSEGALRVAQENAKEQGVEVCFRRADLLNPPSIPSSIHLLVSNPPYVTEKEKAGIEAHVLNYEPATALFVPDDDALRFYRALARLATERLAEGGAIAVEINRNYGKETAQMFENYGLREVEILKDAFGNDRFVTGRKR